jgi:HEPN domain-containing protein
MRWREHAELLLRKAAQDEFTVEKLFPDPASPDEVIGFHAQQVVEKTLKAVLALRAVPYRIFSSGNVCQYCYPDPRGR